MQCENAEHWRAAINDEDRSLLANNIWTLTDLPAGRTPIKSKWVFKIKTEADGCSPRFRARLVAKGFSQRPGLDYFETFSPVVKYDTLRVLLALTAIYDLDLFQLDVKTAFLYGDLTEEIFMKQPEELVENDKKSQVCRLNKSLYGLKQASRVWNKHFDYFLKQFGFIQSEADSCLYFRRDKDDFVFIAIWVDDGLMGSNNLSLISNMIDHLSKSLEMRSGPANGFVGLTITRNRSERTLYLSQRDYTLRVLDHFHMTDCRPTDLPGDPGTRLMDNPAADPVTVPYREAVGCLLYLATISRPNISFAVGQVSHFCQNPKKQASC